MKKGKLFTTILVLVLALGACSGNTGKEDGSGPTQVGAHETGKDQEKGVMVIMGYDFSAFSNVSVTGIKLDSLNEEELAVLYAQARYCQAMTDADIDTMRELVSEDMIFTHMSGRQQTREEYFADVADGSLDYFTIGIDNPVITVDSDTAQITYTAVLNADAYGARGTFRMGGTHHYEKRDGDWIAVNR